jgi:hypothetical protein
MKRISTAWVYLDPEVDVGCSSHSPGVKLVRNILQFIVHNYLPDLVGKALDKEAVVDDSDDGALKGAESCFKARPRRDVKVVNRFVEQQQVAAARCNRLISSCWFL